jgi:hypothetical protein
LLALIDSHPGPLDIRISSSSTGSEVMLSLSAKPAERKTPFPPLTLYRALSCEDVMAIGKANGAACSCADGAITIALPAKSAA